MILQLLKMAYILPAISLILTKINQFEQISFPDWPCRKQQNLDHSDRKGQPDSRVPQKENEKE